MSDSKITIGQVTALQLEKGLHPRQAIAMLKERQREVTKQNLLTACDLAQSVDELRIVVKRLVQEVM